jgi:hypothetical protein
MSQILGLRTSYCYFADSLWDFSDLGCMQQLMEQREQSQARLNFAESRQKSRTAQSV